MRWLGWLLVLTLTGCVSPVVIDHQAGIDFSHYHRYSLAPPSGDQQVLSLDGQRVQGALRGALASAGLSPADASKADVLVRYRFKPVAHFQGNVVQFGFGFWHSNLGLGAETPVEGTTVREDRLRVEMVDRGSNQVVWQATSRDTLDPDMDSEQRAQRIKGMVRDMFQRYPPGQGQ